MTANGKQSILFLSLEVAPIAVVGGLSQVVRFLPKQLRASGYDVRIALPDYSPLFAEVARRPLLGKLPVFFAGKVQNLRVSEATLDDSIPVYLISGMPGFASIVDPKRDLYSRTRIEDYAFWGMAVLEMLQAMGEEEIWQPDFIHAHDYHAAFATIYLKSVFGNRLRGFANAPKTIFTIHNLGFPGRFAAGIMSQLGLPAQLASSPWMEFYGDMSTLKGGITLSDVVTTVSPTYALEILTETYGEGLQGVLHERHRFSRLRGILNGIDREELALETSESEPPLDTSKGFEDFLKTKAAAKAKLRAKAGLQQRDDRPLLAIMGRWGWQKGWPLFAELLLNGYLSDFQVLLETWASAGQDEYLMNRLREHQRHHSGNVALFENQPPDRLRLAAPDFVLIPSLYEPCGLVQMEAMCFATLPIVRRTGGLADTVFDGENGLAFESELSVVDLEQKSQRFYSAVKAMAQSLRRALAIYQDAARLRQLQEHAFRSDNSWPRRMPGYQQLYEDAAMISPVTFGK